MCAANKVKIVIADDELNIIELLQYMLNSASVEIVGVAMNGPDAFECVKEHAPDILITDIRMPGYSGIQLVEKVKSIQPDIDIIVISGYREFDYLQSILHFGVREFLLKPVEEEELNKIISRIAVRRDKKQSRENYIKSIEQSLAESYERLREEYTIKILYGSLDARREPELMKDVFKFRNGKYCVAVLKADCITIDRRTNDTDNILYIQKLLRNYRDIITNQYKAICYEMSAVVYGDKVYFIFNYKEQIEDEEFWNLGITSKIYLEDMLVTENDKYGFLHFSFGIGGSVESLEEIGLSLKAALRSVEKRLDPECSSIIISKISQESDEIDLEKDVQMSLQNAVVSVDTAVIAAEIDKIIDRYVKKKTYFLIYELSKQILNCIREFIITKELLKLEDCREFDKAAEEIDNCFTVEMIRNCLKDSLVSVVSKVETELKMRSNKPIRIALEYMQKNYMNQITLQSVAEVIYYSPNYLSNALKGQTGKTFLEHLTDFRMNAAQELLKNSTKNIGEIAREVGYMDEKYFSRLFSKEVGVKPKEFRKFYS